MSGQAEQSLPRKVFSDPIVQLAALCPLCALAALSPTAALAVLSPTLNRFNPAVNPAAALLAFSQSSPQESITARVRARVGTRLTGVMIKAHQPRMLGS